MSIIIAPTKCNVKLDMLTKSIKLVQMDYPSFAITSYSRANYYVLRSDFESKMFGYPTYLAINNKAKGIELTLLETFATKTRTWYLIPSHKSIYPNPNLCFFGDKLIEEERQTLDILYSGECEILLMDSEYIYAVDKLPDYEMNQEKVMELDVLRK